MKKWLAVAYFLLVALIEGASAQQTLKELRISAIPDENPQEMLRIYTPFADYLTKEIGIPVKFTPVVDYAATVEGLVASQFITRRDTGIHELKNLKGKTFTFGSVSSTSGHFTD